MLCSTVVVLFLFQLLSSLQRNTLKRNICSFPCTLSSWHIYLLLCKKKAFQFVLLGPTLKFQFHHLNMLKEGILTCPLKDDRYLSSFKHWFSNIHLNRTFYRCKDITFAIFSMCSNFKNLNQMCPSLFWVYIWNRSEDSSP